jgi:hypothetical protein
MWGRKEKRTPELQETLSTRERVINNIAGFVYDHATAVNGRKRLVQFTSQLPSHRCMYSHVSGGNTLAYITDKKTFFKVLEEAPDELQLDCASILPVAIIAGIARTMEQDGIDRNCIADATEAIVLAGEDSQIKVNNTTYLPFQPSGDSRYGIGLGIPKFVQVHAQIGNAWDPSSSTTTFHTNLEYGDIFSFNSTQFRWYPGWGNRHNQNGIVLETGYPVTGDGLVFAHAPVVEERISTIGYEFLKIYRNLTEIGITESDFKRGRGISVYGAGVDYERLYLSFLNGVINM